MSEMKRLTITWQRLVSAGQTCPRCGATGEEIDKAVTQLRQALTPLGIEVALDKEELSLEQFSQTPLQSNTIRLNGRLLEEWLGATSGQSRCCEVCGPNDCRTVQVAEEVYEAIPAELIVKAGLLAAELLSGKGCGCKSDAPSSGGGCCSK